jgi:hypothetical protein
MAHEFAIQSKRVQISTNGFGQGTVKLDGLDVSAAVRGVSFRTSAEDRDEVVIELSVDQIEISLLADPDKTIQVLIPTAVVDVLKRIGWVPPADGATTYRIPHEPVCTCSPYELAASDGVHADSCPLFITDNQSPDAND